MAKTRGGQQSESGGVARLLMVAAVVAIGGLFVYLAYASQPTEAPVVVTGDEEVGQDVGPTAPPVTALDFGTAPRTYVGQDIDLQGVTVAQIMSPEIIWVDVPTPQGSSPYLVKLSATLAAQGAPALQAVVNVTGRVLEKTDSVLSAWEVSGAIQDAGQRAQAEFGGTFIEATQIRPSGSQ